MNVQPTPTRSLRNEIARHLMEGYDETVEQMRKALDAAQVAVDACSAYALVFGPQALVNAVAA